MAQLCRYVSTFLSVPSLIFPLPTPLSLFPLKSIICSLHACKCLEGWEDPRALSPRCLSPCPCVHARPCSSLKNTQQLWQRPLTDNNSEHGNAASLFIDTRRWQIHLRLRGGAALRAKKEAAEAQHQKASLAEYHKWHELADQTEKTGIMRLVSHNFIFLSFKTLQVQDGKFWTAAGGRSLVPEA